MDTKTARDTSKIMGQFNACEEATQNLDAKICALYDKLGPVLAMDQVEACADKPGVNAPRSESDLYLKLETLKYRLARLAAFVESITERAEC